MVEFQAVVMAAGHGSRLPDMGVPINKFLLPVGAYPLIWYPLNLLERQGFQEVIVIVLDEHKSDIENALEKCPLKLKLDYVSIPSEEDWGTADSLRSIKERIYADVIIVPGDIITTINLDELINLFRRHNASVSSLFFNNGPQEYIELPGPKSKQRPERDLIGLDSESKRLVFLASASDYDESVDISRVLLKKHGHVKMFSRLLDSHVYILKKWIINFISQESHLSSLKGEVLPLVIKKQLSKPQVITDEDKHAFPKEHPQTNDIFEFAKPGMYDQQIRQASTYSDRSYGNKGGYQDDLIRCYAYISDKSEYALRCNTLSSFCLANSKITTMFEDIAGNPSTRKINTNSNVLSKQVDDISYVGEHTTINEKCSIKNTIIGTHCTIENKVRIANCIIMNNIIVKEGSVLDNCILFSGATIDNGCSLQFCLIGPHHTVPNGTSSNHQLYCETSDDMITVG